MNWIEVKDRLPNLTEYKQNDGEFLVATSNGNYEIAYLSYYPQTGKPMWATTEKMNEIVIAWTSFSPYAAIEMVRNL